MDTRFHIMLIIGICLFVPIKGFPQILNPPEKPPTDSYLYKDDCPGSGSKVIVDKWSFFKCECTSYVAFKLNQRGIPFSNAYKKVHWGYASNWINAADKARITVDKSPKAGDVAAFNYGHVAYVESVNSDGSIVVTEYNYSPSYRYNSRPVTISKDKVAGFIHFEVIPDSISNPPPSLQQINLNGEWTATGYPGVDQIKVRIRQDGDKVEATKLTSGSSSVPSGEVTWFGTYTSSRFFGKIQAADNGFTNTRWIEIVIKVSDKTHIEVTMLDSDPVSGQRWGPLKFVRL